MLSPEAIARVSTVLNLFSLRGVIRMVTVTPRLASNLAMSTMGIMWPWAMKGNRTK